jgi:hypothetical protein
VRRAHPHTYWTGPGRTVAVVRWVSPVLVGLHGGDAAVTTVVKA